MNDNLKKDMKEMFESDVPDVLSKIKNNPKFYVPEQESGFTLSKLFNRKVSLSFMGTFVILLLVAITYRGLNTPVVASTITVDLNPSIMITLDENDEVINVKGLNDDGETIITVTRKYRGWTIEDTIDDLVDILNDRGYIVTTSDEYNILLIEVDTTNEAKRTALAERFEKQFNAKLQQYNSEHWVLDSEDIEVSAQDLNKIKNDPRSNQYTMAKMLLIYRIHELDNDLTINELSEMIVRELYDLYIEKEDSSRFPNYENMPKKTRRSNSKTDDFDLIFAI